MVKYRQLGISPKLLTDLIVSVITFLLAHFAITLDAETSAAVAKVVGFIAGAIVGPGRVVPKGV